MLTSKRKYELNATIQSATADMEALFDYLALPQPGDVEQAKRHYLAQFAHKGCGGAPVAYVGSGQLGCSGCKQTWDATGPLGVAVRRTGAFTSLVVP